MKIKYKRKRVYINLVIGSIWIILGILSIWDSIPIRWNDYFYLVIGIFYLTIYLYEYLNQYLTIKDGIIKKHSPFNKDIVLSEVIYIKKFAGDYTLKTKKRELKINSDLISPTSLTELHSILGKIELPNGNNPFTVNS